MFAAALFLAGAAAGAAGATVLCERRARRRGLELGRLLSFAAHELGTPVTAVNMTVVNVLSGVFGELPAAQRPWMEMTREQIAHLNSMLGELRDFVHLGLRREFSADLAEIRPEQILEQALGSLRRGFEQAGAAVEVFVEPELPALLTDGGRAARSLSSLLFHARKFRLDGPVRLSLAAAANGVLYTVEYKGSALSSEAARACLEAYYPGRDRADQILTATGLGLGVVRLIMERLGGTVGIDVASDGLTRLTLALAPSAPAERSGAQEAR